MCRTGMKQHLGSGVCMGPRLTESLCCSLFDLTEMPGDVDTVSFPKMQLIPDALVIEFDE